MTTMVALKRALSLMPITRIAVITRAIRKPKIEADLHAKNLWRVDKVMRALHQFRERAERMALTLSRKALRARCQAGISHLGHVPRNDLLAVAKPVQWS